MTDYAKWDRFAADVSSSSESENEALKSEIEGIAREREASSREEDLGTATHQPPPPATASSSGKDDPAPLGSDIEPSPVEQSLAAQKLVDELRLKERGLIELRHRKDECDSVREVLSFLPSKTRHQVMVPVGRGQLCFQEGEILHAGEVYVKLDEETFVERTCEQAAGILQRRSEGLEGAAEALERGIVSLRSAVASETDRLRKAAVKAKLDALELVARQKSNLVDIEVGAEEEEYWSGKDRRVPPRSSGPAVTDEEFESTLTKLSALEKLEEGETSDSTQEAAAPTAAGVSAPQEVKARDGGGEGTRDPIEEGSDGRRATKQRDAFTGSIVEKSKPGSPSQGSDTANTTRPVSRFKLSLQNRKPS